MSESINVGYRHLPDNVLRPYLFVNITGPNGISRSVLGIVDSGADQSCFPLGFITEFGYDLGDLTEQEMTQAGGTTKSYITSIECSAVVVDLESSPFVICPTFLDGQYVLWGRADFMNNFDLEFIQSQNRFVLTSH